VLLAAAGLGIIVSWGRQQRPTTATPLRWTAGQGRVRLGTCMYNGPPCDSWATFSDHNRKYPGRMLAGQPRPLTATAFNCHGTVLLVLRHTDRAVAAIRHACNSTALRNTLVYSDGLSATAAPAADDGEAPPERRCTLPHDPQQPTAHSLHNHTHLKLLHTCSHCSPTQHTYAVHIEKKSTSSTKKMAESPCGCVNHTCQGAAALQPTSMHA
jgi:hypothetical protein